MRKLKITTIIFLAGAAVCLTAILFLALSGEGRLGAERDSGAASSGNYRLVLEREIDPNTVDTLKIDYGMTYNDVYFCPTDGEKILIREYMNFSPKENQISRVEQKEGELSVKGVKRNRFLFFSLPFLPGGGAYTEIHVPASLAERLTDLYVRTVNGDIVSDISFRNLEESYASTTSGDLSLPELEAGQIQLSSTSGNVRLTRAVSETLHVSTVSGDIFLGQSQSDTTLSTTSGNVTADRLEGDVRASTVSGDLSLGEVRGDMLFSTTSGITHLGEGTGRFEADTTSGDIRVEELRGNFLIDSTSGDVYVSDGSGCGRADTVSGDVHISLGELTGGLNVSTTSGNAVLELPGTGSWTLDFDSVSGECSTFFDERLHFNKRGNKASGTYGDGENKIDVSTTSGDLRITEYEISD